MLKSNWLNFYLLSFLHLAVTIHGQTTYPPIWVTNNYVRADNNLVIGNLTGNSSRPNHTFIFSSAFTTGIPNLGYGIKAYQGNDYFGQQKFQVNRTSLTATSFSVTIQILGVTNIYVLNVPYIAIDITFPHHLNSFDNVPVNYGSTLENITAASPNQTLYYTHQINYTQQVGSSSIYNTFASPYSRNKILLFMTSLFIFGQNEDTPTYTAQGGPPYNPLDLRVDAAVVSVDLYEINVSLRIKVRIQKLHFSIIIFDQQDVQRSGLYLLIYQKISFTDAGGFVPLPFQFIDNFIMGFTEFSSIRTKCAIHFQWDYQIVGGVQGVLMPPSVGRSPLGFVINEVRFTMFYMKTWTCPSQTFFDPAQDLCTGCPIHNCLNCFTFYVCATCDSGYTFNSFTGQCQSSEPQLSIKRSSCNGFTVTVPKKFYQSSTEDTIQNGNIVVISSVESDTNMTILAEYNSDIYGQKIKVRIRPNFYQQIDYNPVVPSVYYSQNQCQTMKSIQSLKVAIQVVSYIILLLSLISMKIVGLELFGVLQLAYFSLASHSYFDLYLSPFTGLRSTNGLNVNIMADNSKIPDHFKQMNVSAAYLNNFNVMFLLIVVELLIGAVLYLIGVKFVKQKPKRISVILLRQGFVTLIVFNVFNLSFSSGIQLSYGTDSNYAWANYLVLVISLIAVLLAIFFMETAKKESEYGQFKKKFKDTCVCKIYLTVSILYRICLGFYISLENDYQESTLIILAISLIYIMYNITNLPFSNAIQNYRANLCHITQIVILITTNYYRSMKSTTPMQVKAHLHTAAIIEILMIVICVLVSLGVLIYEIVLILKRFKLKKQNNTNIVVGGQVIQRYKNKSQMNINENEREYTQNYIPAQ